MTKKAEAAAAVAKQQFDRRRRLDDLKVKLKARNGKPEYKENCESLRTAIGNLEKVIALVDAGLAE